MQLAEMESRMYNQSFMTNTDELERLTNVEATINDPQFLEIDDAKKVKILERSIKRLSTSIRACMQEKLQFNKEITELKHQIEKDKEFNEKMQARAREDKEMVLYYQ